MYKVRCLALHAHVTSVTRHFTGFLDDYVVATLTTCGMNDNVHQVLLAKDCTSSSSRVLLKSSQMQCGKEDEALQLHQHLQREGFKPSARKFIALLRACGSIPDLAQGRKLHVEARKHGFLSDIYVGNTLLNMYGKCGTVSEAEDVFALYQSVRLCPGMLCSQYMHMMVKEKKCYKHIGKCRLMARHLMYVRLLLFCRRAVHFQKMQETWLSDKQQASFGIGQAFHSLVLKKGLSRNPLIGNTLVSFYGKCGAVAEAATTFEALSIKEAEEAFYMLSYHDIVSWNVLVSVYVEQGDREKAFCLYKQMQEQSLAVDEVTLIYVLQACSEHGSLEFCEELHFHMVCMGQGKLSSLVATLIRAYGNCGCLLSAEVCFEDIFSPDLVSWSVLLSGYAGEGNDCLALQLFARLSMARILPLCLCFHPHCLQPFWPYFRGMECFESMTRDYYTTPKLMHYGAIMDLFGRAGEFKRVSDMLIRMPMQPDLPIWWFLLGACRTHSNLELAERAFGYAMALQPKQATAYILMSYAYATAGLPDCVKEVEILREKHGSRWSELD
ncbi:hypothetical protein L7F22_002520 [Adiantum nelumboides]|nr:hypothetical protein [Adiantum nelumboides]